MENNTQLKAGDKVYVRRFLSYSWYYTRGVVVKVTPSGMVDVRLGTEMVVRFASDGKERGAESRSKHELDVLPYAQREAELASEVRAKDACHKIRVVCEDVRVRAEWGKASLLAIVADLQKKLDEAKAAVEAI